MIATRRFVFLHLHKSGGTFVNRWLLRHFRDARQIGYHLPRRLIPAELAHLPVLGLVRNPWSYYVSWYTFQSGMARPNPLFHILSDGGKLSFLGTIRNMVELGNEERYLDRIVAVLPSSYGRSGLNLPGPELARIRDTGSGFYSFLYAYMYGEGPASLARMEHMREELPPLLRDLGENLGEEALTDLKAASPVNATAHRHYAEYYDSSLRALVARRDSVVIERHGYQFGN